MNQNKISEEVIALANHTLKIKIDANSLKASLILDLGADSLNMVELLMAIEEEFSIQFPDSLTEKLNTLQDIIDHTVLLAESSNSRK